MILLDTNHLSALKYRDTDRGRRLLGRLAESHSEVIGTPIICVEEQMRGWLVSIAKERNPRRQIGPYHELAALFKFFQPFHIALFDEAAATVFDGFS